MLSTCKARPKKKTGCKKKKKKTCNIYTRAQRSSHFCYPIQLYEPGDMILRRPPCPIQLSAYMHRTYMSKSHWSICCSRKNKIWNITEIQVKSQNRTIQPSICHSLCVNRGGMTQRPTPVSYSLQLACIEHTYTYNHSISHVAEEMNINTIVA